MAALIIRTVLWYSICNYAKKLESIGAIFIPASVLIIGCATCQFWDKLQRSGLVSRDVGCTLRPHSMSFLWFIRLMAKILHDPK